MADSQGPAERVISVARRLIGNVVAMGETRLRLAVLELELERDRLLSLLLIAGASLILFSFGIGMLLLLVVVLFWDEHRLLVISLCSLALLLGATLLAVKAKRIATQRRLMESTLHNMQQDRQALESSHDS